MRRLLGAALILAAPLCGAAAPEPREGQLRILADGQLIGRERYQITRTATEIQANGEVDLEIEGQKVRQTSRLLLGADLAPRSYEWKTETPKTAWVRIEFAGAVATVRYLPPDAKEDQQVFTFDTPRVALLDNNFFHQYLLLAELYDYQAGGAQTVKVFVPQAVQPGEVRLELRGVETLEVEGQPQPVRQLAITTEDNEVLLWVTESGRFVRLRAPQMNVEVVPESAAP
ncbi:MAG: hypothetical protein A3B65_02475 [Acidobacteria bacterium RIFCSPHIGHO2_02_FULL_67_57]|nr:MAG: hypothetical protein A3B65_02475 [Acidobacteria bacterium RIFCSPHIGHO2_02_FULL_67_57]OFV85897.1 MAG: hypothetical protein A2620_01240 [Acidobacteria bacterium RIFCSPHIGHO2_01_FULL_67_28]